MRTLTQVATLAAMTLLLGCEANQAANNALADDVVRFTYEAKTNEAGDCTPFYTAFTNKDADGLSANQIYIIRGETEYFEGEYKIGEVPFQVKMYKLNQGMPSEGVACADLKIKITLDECSYAYPSERTACPPIEVVGSEAFGELKIVDTTKN